MMGVWNAEQGVGVLEAPKLWTGCQTYFNIPPSCCLMKEISGYLMCWASHQPECLGNTSGNVMLYTQLQGMEDTLL